MQKCGKKTYPTLSIITWRNIIRF